MATSGFHDATYLRTSAERASPSAVRGDAPTASICNVHRTGCQPFPRDEPESMLFGCRLKRALVERSASVAKNHSGVGALLRSGRNNRNTTEGNEKKPLKHIQPHFVVGLRARAPRSARVSCASIVRETSTHSHRSEHHTESVRCFTLQVLRGVSGVGTASKRSTIESDVGERA